jgi:S1-C subfamily serine protease
LNGELIGVNTAIFSRSGGSNGIGFAIPAELVARAVDSAVTTGEIVRPWIGARTDAVDSVMAAALGLDRARGTVINEILPGGPADEGGLEKGDVILSVGGDDVNDDSGLRFKLATLRRGERTEVTYVRDGRERRTRVTVDTPKETPLRDLRSLNGAHPLDGATVANLSPALAEELGFDPYATGIIVTDIERRSAARYNGARRGTIIREINGRAVASTRDLDGVLASEAILAQEAGDSPFWDVEVEISGRIGRLPVRYVGETG